MKLATLLLAVAACAPNPRIVRPNIGTIKLGLSNVHLVKGTSPLVVDTGTATEFDQIEDGLEKLGVALRDVKCAVVTHAHGDHAGNARELQQHGIKIIAGAGDVAAYARGYHRIVAPTSLMATMLRWYLPNTYGPFKPDVEVTDRYDLAACGVAGEVIAMPGHTPGSLVVLVDGGKTALVGDLFRGGPKEHFYQENLEQAHAQIRALLARGVEWFILGHDGPEPRAAVEKEFGK